MLQNHYFIFNLFLQILLLYIYSVDYYLKENKTKFIDLIIQQLDLSKFSYLLYEI